MGIRASIITRALHTRGVAVFAALLVVAGALTVFIGGDYMPVSGDRGFALLSANEWLPAGWPDFALALAVNAAIIWVMSMMNVVYNILRSMTALFITLFAFMQAATPGLLVQFYTGPLLALTVGVCLLRMFGSYRSESAPRRVFTVFLLLSFLTATQYCYSLYLPVFLICCAQMRVFDGRALAAAFMGTVTPWWLLLGFGVISFSDLHLPDFAYILGNLDIGESLFLLISVGFTVVLLILSLVLNLFKTIAYNARSRAVNGALTVVALFTLLGLCIDYSNMISYITLLNMCTALQTAHYFATHRSDSTCFAILGIIAVYIALFVCQTIL